jgi:hypothetical protein
MAIKSKERFILSMLLSVDLRLLLAVMNDKEQDLRS